MAEFRLARKALQDVASTISFFHREVSPDVADKIELRLFKAFDDLAEQRAIGHRRPDITRKDWLFYLSDPYIIVFRKDSQATLILRVIHKSRDMRRLLQ